MPRMPMTADRTATQTGTFSDASAMMASTPAYGITAPPSCYEKPREPAHRWACTQGGYRRVRLAEILMLERVVLPFGFLRRIPWHAADLRVIRTREIKPGYVSDQVGEQDEPGGGGG